MRKRIDIAFISDENYLLTTSVAIRSLIRHISSEYDYVIYIVTNEEGQKVWNELYKVKTPLNVRVECVLYHVPFEKFEFKHGYVSKTALIKFYLPEIFPYLDKLLYLDGDILFFRNIADVFHIDIDSLYAAVVKDMLAYDGNHRASIGVDEYFNSGIMLLNLKKEREDKIVTKLVEYRINQTDTSYMDQDAFNVVFDHKVKFISPVYNMIQECFNVYSKCEIAKFYDILQEDLDDVAVVHMAGPVKPWRNVKAEQFSEWISYLNDIQELSICVKNYLLTLEQTENQKIDQITQDISHRFQECNSKIKYLEDENVQRLMEKNALEKKCLELDNKICAYEDDYRVLSEKFQDLSQKQDLCLNELQNRIEMLENALSKRIVRKIKRLFKIS